MATFCILSLGVIVGLFLERCVKAMELADQNCISWSDAMWLLDNSVNNRIPRNQRPRKKRQQAEPDNTPLLLRPWWSRQSIWAQQ